MNGALFENREDAGLKLASKLTSYQKDPVLILALPRGGVPLGAVIANKLKAPLNLIFAHKIGHPYQKEYAVAAVSEKGFVIQNPKESGGLDPNWLEKEKEATLFEIQQRRLRYNPLPLPQDLKNRTAILVDDGVATGLTLQAAVLELKSLKPKKIVIAVPVTPESTFNLLKSQVNDVVALQVDSSAQFLGSVGAYYRNFPQVDDDEVIALLKHSTHPNR